MNIREFMGLNAQWKDQNGNNVPHEEIYTRLVNAIGIDTCFKYVPATEEEIIRALQTDKYLNNIPLEKWDRQRPYASRLLASIGIRSTSLAQCNCLLKQTARMKVAESFEKSGQMLQPI